MLDVSTLAYGNSNSEIWVLAQGNVERGRLVINGNVNLLLEDGCELTVNGGICVKAGYTLSIYAQSRGVEAGVLLSRGGSQPRSAGIGANGGNDGGNVAIHGGNITAQGSNNSAGIGGQGAHSCQDIVITGGNVTAIGGNQSPGIGAGWNGAAGDIMISGGCVSATGGLPMIIGGEQGAGIGAGAESSSSCGDILIMDGAVIQANSISNKSREGEWNGLVFEGNDGRVYGGSVAPAESFEIGSGKTLTVNKGDNLTIGSGITLSNEGTITNNGVIRVMQGGRLDVEGALDGENTRAVILDVGADVDLAGAPQRTYDADVDMPADATKIGYTLDGWYEKGSNKRVTAVPAAIGSDKIYFTKWIINQYTISFDTDGGSNIAPITQDYDTAVTAPDNPTRVGYTFAGWSESVPATMPAKDIKLIANWTANTNTPYKVEHWMQQTNLEGYALSETENLTGTTDTMAKAVAKNRTGFTLNSNAADAQASGNIDGDGALVLRLYYDRDVYGVTLDAKGGKVNKGVVNSYTTRRSRASRSRPSAPMLRARRSTTLSGQRSTTTAQLRCPPRPRPAPSLGSLRAPSARLAARC